MIPRITGEQKRESQMKVVLVRSNALEQARTVKITGKKGLTDVLMPEEFSPDRPILISAPTGMGKSTFISKSLAQYATETGKRILFVSSRVPINTQQKMGIAKTVGEPQLLDELTGAGWQAREAIGCVCIITYHRLSRLMKNPKECEGLKGCFDFFVLDEVHALVRDATFTSCTGELLSQIPSVFYDAARIYMSATPEPILEALAEAEIHALTIYHWPRDFSWVKPFFFSDAEQLAQRINEDTTGDKWLVFMGGIEEGALFSQLLRVPCILINSKTRKNDPDQRQALLETERFEAKVLISTSVLDCGVNFKDPALRKIATTSHHTDVIIQQLGRKRRKKSETVELYLYDLPLDEIRRRKRQTARSLEAIGKIGQRAEFLSSYIYGDDLPLVRGFFWISSDGQEHLNPLVKCNLTADYELLSSLEVATLKEKSGFPKLICKALGQKIPANPAQWLDGRRNGSAEENFKKFLQKNLNRPIEEAEQDVFAKRLRSMYIAAFGKNKNDRPDRNWQAPTIRNRIEPLNWGYTINEKDKVWIIHKVGEEF